MRREEILSRLRHRGAGAVWGAERARRLLTLLLSAHRRELFLGLLD
jgi:hypothetical protein